MRTIFLLPLLMAAACSVDNDAANDKVTVEYDQQRIENAAAKAARTAKEVGSGVGNVAATTGRAIKKEVGDIDVDVDVSRKKSDSANNEAARR
jgi:hypothetical protein